MIEAVYVPDNVIKMYDDFESQLKVAKYLSGSKGIGEEELNPYMDNSDAWKHS